MAVLTVELKEPPKLSERAWLIQEVEGKARGENVRIQTIAVIRDDKIGLYTEVLGPALGVPGFKIPLMLEHSVDEAYDLAAMTRENAWAKNIQGEVREKSTLVEDWIRQSEEDARILKNQSTFGLGGSVQRNGYSRMAARLNKEKAENGY